MDMSLLHSFHHTCIPYGLGDMLLENACFSRNAGKNKISLQKLV